MNMPSKSTPNGRMVRGSRHTLARMRANPQAKKHLGELEPQHKALKAAQLAWNDADDAVVDADAEVLEVDFLAKEQLTDLQLDLTSYVKRDYADPLYRALLPKGLTDLKRTKRADLRDEVARVVAILGDLAKDHPLFKHGVILGKTFKAWEEPLKTLARAETNRLKADNAILAARNAWLLAYDGLAGTLRKEFPRRKVFVDSFFYDFGGKSKAKAVAPVEPAMQA